MVSFKDITEDRHQPLDLSRELEKLRIQVGLAEQGVPIEETYGAVAVDGFASSKDFVPREDSVSYTNGDSYQGWMLGPLRHGRGRHSCSSGDVYEGSWAYDKRDGRGRLSLSNGMEYEGEWKADLAHGQARCRYPNGGVYQGEFAADKRCGWGEHRFPDGSVYEGEWEADAMQGRGVMRGADGSTFEGEWRAGERARGKQRSADGSSEYTGDFSGEFYHGEGTLWQRGSRRYRGSWVQGLQEGQGRCEYADGSAYEGAWLGGQRHGVGRWSGGGPEPEAYVGEWVRDRRQGRGVLTRGRDAAFKYVGEFREDQRWGRGTCAFPDGAKYEGDWVRDAREGQGACAYPSGDRYRGSWLADRRHGRGACRFADGTVFRGEWDADEWVQSSADPAKSRVAGPGLTRAAAGAEAAFAIEARDEAGNRRLSGGDEFKVLALGSDVSAAATGAVEDRGDGSYRVTLTPQVAGLYRLHVTTADAEHVAQSPYPLRVLPGPPALRQCIVRVESEEGGTGQEEKGAEDDGAEEKGAEETALARPRASAQLVTRPGCPAVVEIAVRDAFGNACRDRDLSQDLPLNVRLEKAGWEQVVRLDYGRDGRVLGAFSLPSEGAFRLHVETVAGQALPRTPCSVIAAEPGAQARGEEAGASSKTASFSASSVHPAASSAQPAASSVHPAVAPASPPAPSASPAAAAPPPPLPELAAPPPVDAARVWEDLARAAYAADGDARGWDSGGEEAGRKDPGVAQQEAYLKAHPGVPVVENLEDVWKVSKLQQERKSAEERSKQKKLRKVQASLQQTFGQAQPPSQEEMQKAVREIVLRDLEAPDRPEEQPSRPARKKPSQAPRLAASKAHLRQQAALLDEWD